LFQRVEFAVEANPMARIAYALYQGRFLNAVSVGFIPLRWENGDARTGQPAFRRRYLEQELLEVSAVGIPANPEALQLGLRAGAVARGDLRELAGLLDCLLAGAASPDRRLLAQARLLKGILA
jgi:phage head maturation protease